MAAVSLSVTIDPGEKCDNRYPASVNLKVVGAKSTDSGFASLALWTSLRLSASFGCPFPLGYRSLFVVILAYLHAQAQLYFVLLLYLLH